MTNTTNEKVGHTPGPWQQGRLLMTRDVLKWSPVAISDGQRFESRCVFSGFTAEDEGKSRRLVAICERPEDAAHIAEYPSLTAERDTLKAQAARYEYVRTLNPRSFQELWTRCMNEAIQFDKAVDEGIAHREITRARSILK